MPGRQHHGYPLAVPGRQFLGDAVGKRPVAADDEMVTAVIRTPGERRHDAIIVAVRSALGDQPLPDRSVRSDAVPRDVWFLPAPL